MRVALVNLSENGMPVLQRMADRSTARRMVVSGVGIAAVIAATPGFGVALRSACQARRGREMWRDPGAVRTVGRRYLELAGNETDRARLSDLIFGNAELPDMSFWSLQRHIAAGRARDYAAGDTIMLDGWILSRTEARLCALCSLA